MVFIENSFICPDGFTIPTSECLESCRMNTRCLAKPLLLFASRTRDLNRRHFSATELLAPTLIMYLKHKYGEYIDPKTVMPAAIGTATHAILEDCFPRNYTGEFRLEYKGVTGQMDCIDLENKVLYDYKITSAYKVCSMLGMAWKWQEHTITRGKRKGEKTWKKVWSDGGLHHYGDYCKQQNLYRYLIQKTMGIEIKQMFLQCIIKEPASYLKDYGLDTNCYLIELPKMNGERLFNYVSYKRQYLLDCIDNNEIPRQCSAKETWNGRRCKDYCSVRHVCPYVR